MTLTEEWIAKAEGDFETAEAVWRLRKKPQYDAVCYHCQQSAEKYLKAFLVNKGVVPRRIHDLVDLMQDCAIHDPSILLLEPDLHTISIQRGVPLSRRLRNSR